MLVGPYLFFDGRCEEALNFYTQAVGAQVLMMMRFKDNPEPREDSKPDSANAEKVMHASVRIGESVIMASDGDNRGAPNFSGFSLSLTVTDDAEAKRCFSALAEGGQIVMPLDQTFFASSFGMLRDRFGMHWMVMAPSGHAG